jgi:hypothetical protein
MREEMLAVGGRRWDELPGLPRAYCSTVSRSTMMSQLLDHDPVDGAVQRGAPRQQQRALALALEMAPMGVSPLTRPTDSHSLKTRLDSLQ